MERRSCDRRMRKRRFVLSVGVRAGSLRRRRSDSRAAATDTGVPFAAGYAAEPCLPENGCFG
jgi:hypothetical protein